MRSEFQFIMSAEDMSEFDDFLLSHDGVEIESRKGFDVVHYESAEFQYMRSGIYEDLLTVGRIALATTDLDKQPNFENSHQIEKLYKRCRTWLRKRYSNCLEAVNYNVTPPAKCAVKYVWLGPNAEKWLDSGRGKLRLFPKNGVYLEKLT
jgi:hypothetical protein